MIEARIRTVPGARCKRVAEYTRARPKPSPSAGRYLWVKSLDVVQ
jgi:hypothetical protein